MSFITNKPSLPQTVPNIPTVGAEYYENIFNMYQTQNNDAYNYFNISNKVEIDTTNIDENYLQYFYIDTPMPLTTLSYRIFGTQHLWWLIVAMNKLNPIDIPASGTVIAVPIPQFVSTVLNSIKR
jgi:hypothetical protein